MLKSPSKAGLISWALYDWANSAFSAIIQTFVFAAYFTTHVAENETIGTTQWGIASSAAGLMIALGSPILGSIADASGYHKRWIAFFAGICILATASLWTIHPSPEYVTQALVLVTIAIIGSEFSYVFYNAMLPGLSPSNEIGRWSGWGWACGYAGGTVSLLGALAFTKSIPTICLLTAAWFFIFSLPLFLFTKETAVKQKTIMQAAKGGLSQLKHTLAHLKQYKNIAHFLASNLFYMNGLTTIFAFGGVFAASTFHFSANQVIIFGICLNIMGGLGAATFAFLDDRIGGRQTILIGLIGLLISATIALSATNEILFWIFGLTMGLFVGPVQASARSYIARVSPGNLKTQMFGFLALTGKATAFLGPALVSWVTYLTGSERIGLSPVLLLLAIGLSLLLFVPRDK